jgi:phospholipid-transporting ATPase
LQDESGIIDEYWKALSLAHECGIEERDNNVIYTGLSPDDIELVNSAAAQGYVYTKSDSNVVRKVNIAGKERQFELLNLIEFNSDRKRLSVVVRDNDKIKLYIKGADTEIKKKLSKNTRSQFLDQANTYVEYFSNKGFRTLFVAMKLLDEKEYEEWNKKFYEANMNLNDKKKALDKVYDEIESNVNLLGATIVEDRLQDMVPETIRDLRLAGIKIWMLTGDKMDTAYNIGLSCNLISKELTNFKICGEKGDKPSKLTNEYNEFLKKYSDSISPPAFSILVDATALAMILKSKEAVIDFLNIASRAISVLCCRVTPLQKSDVVRIMKEYNPLATTLAVGDGGNDVSMIMEAHIGM